MNTPDGEQALWQQAGGEAGLRAVVADFYDRVFDDVMIGFFFRGKDKARLIEKEVELALRMLGAEVEYTGKPVREAHAPHRILGGQFDRRLQILRETMEAHGLPAAVRDAWVRHTLSLREQVTRDASGECRPPLP